MLFEEMEQVLTGRRHVVGVKMQPAYKPLDAFDGLEEYNKLENVLNFQHISVISGKNVELALSAGQYPAKGEYLVLGCVYHDGQVVNIYQHAFESLTRLFDFVMDEVEDHVANEDFEEVFDYA